MKTGLSEGELVKVSSLGTEAVHLSLLAKTLDKEDYSDLFYSEEEALVLVGKKLSTYE